MNGFVIFFMVSFLLVVLLKFLATGISESSVLMREELSSYECGFEHHNLSRVPFSFRYFLLTLIFLLFDLEVILLLGVAYVSSFSSMLSFFLLVCISFLVVLVLGWLYEYYLGRLDWLSS